ncbi:MAG: O-methyltransferase [Catenisphaera adipataccumulans]|uniref:O-methyltransferase n=1 Tax=Catenisphaera adipataccumulans TaxID=700500 RepID=UPI003D91E04B
MKNMEDIETYAAQHRVPVMMDEGLELLKRKIIEYDCRSFLEIGTAVGRTSLVVAGLFPNMRVVTIERDPEMIAQAKENFFDSPFKDKITLIEGDALEVEVEGTFDCIFIDAAKAQYVRFFNKYYPHLSENGIIVSDNMNFHGLVEHPERTNNRGTKQLVRKLKAYKEYLGALVDFETAFYEDGDGVAITRRRK